MPNMQGYIDCILFVLRYKDPFYAIAQKSLKTNTSNIYTTDLLDMPTLSSLVSIHQWKKEAKLIIINKQTSYIPQ